MKVFFGGGGGGVIAHPLPPSTAFFLFLKGPPPFPKWAPPKKRKPLKKIVTKWQEKKKNFKNKLVFPPAFFAKPLNFFGGKKIHKFFIGTNFFPPDFLISGLTALGKKSKIFAIKFCKFINLQSSLFTRIFFFYSKKIFKNESSTFFPMFIYKVKDPKKRKKNFFPNRA